MRNLGIHSFVWIGGSSQDELEEAMRKTHDLGYGMIEFSRLDSTKFDVSWLAKRLEHYALKVAVTMGLPFDGDVSSEDPSVVDRGVSLLESTAAMTRDLGGEKLGGILYSAHGKYSRMPTKKGWDNSVSALSKVADKAKAAGVSLNLEIVNRFESNLINTAAQGVEFVDQSGSDNIYLHLDTFHMNIEEVDPAMAVRLCGNKLGYVHIGESNRGHLGSGVIDFSAIFDALVEIGYADDMTFESFSLRVVDEDLSIVCGIWRDTWTDNVELARLAKEFIEARYAEALHRAKANRFYG